MVEDAGKCSECGGKGAAKPVSQSTLWLPHTAVRPSFKTQGWKRLDHTLLSYVSKKIKRIIQFRVW